jgi:hypothetical protein
MVDKQAPDTQIHTKELPEMPGTQIYWALLRVAKAVEPIVKTTSRDLGYSIAGAEAVMGAVRPHLLEQGVIVFPLESEIVNRDEVETKSGKIMNRTVVKMKFRFMHAPSGTYLDIPVEGEGQDMGDKSINKARTICQKYALRQALMLEFGDADPDKESSDTQERAKRDTTKTTSKPPVEKGHGPEKVDEGTEMAGEEAWNYWLELVKEATALNISTPTFEYPLPLSVLKKAYKQTNDLVKASNPKKEGE